MNLKTIFVLIVVLAVVSLEVEGVLSWLHSVFGKLKSKKKIQQRGGLVASDSSTALISTDTSISLQNDDQTHPFDLSKFQTLFDNEYCTKSCMKKVLHLMCEKPESDLKNKFKSSKTSESEHRVQLDHDGTKLKAAIGLPKKIDVRIDPELQMLSWKKVLYKRKYLKDEECLTTSRFSNLVQISGEECEDSISNLDRKEIYQEIGSKIGHEHGGQGVFVSGCATSEWSYFYRYPLSLENFEKFCFSMVCTYSKELIENDFFENGKNPIPDIVTQWKNSMTHEKQQQPKQ